MAAKEEVKGAPVGAGEGYACAGENVKFWNSEDVERRLGFSGER